MFAGAEKMVCPGVAGNPFSGEAAPTNTGLLRLRVKVVSFMKCALRTNEGEPWLTGQLNHGQASLNQISKWTELNLVPTSEFLSENLQK